MSFSDCGMKHYPTQLAGMHLPTHNYSQSSCDHHAVQERHTHFQNSRRGLSRYPYRLECYQSPQPRRHPVPGHSARGDLHLLTWMNSGWQRCLYPCTSSRGDWSEASYNLTLRTTDLLPGCLQEMEPGSCRIDQKPGIAAYAQWSRQPRYYASQQFESRRAGSHVSKPHCGFGYLGSGLQLRRLTLDSTAHRGSTSGCGCLVLRSSSTWGIRDRVALFLVVRPLGG